MKFLKKLEKKLQASEAFTLIGLVGVSRKESKRARIWGIFFGYVAVIVSIILLLQWQLELLHQISLKNSYIINLIIWLFFIAQLVILLVVVKNPWRYLRQNWSIPVIILLGIFFVINDVPVIGFLQGMRPFLAIFILIPSLRLLIRFFVDGQLTTTLLAAAIIVIIFGLLVGGVDPNVKTPWDGIWWAVATVSTIGYGDVVPSSALGRLLGIGLVILGLGIFVVITANFLALLLRREVEEVKKEEKEIARVLKIVQSIQSLQEEDTKVIKKLAKQLQKLEQNIDSKDKKV